MGKGIIICGCNGSGKSTLGKALANRLDWEFIDMEDCFFPKDTGDYPYAVSHSREEASAILLERAQSCRNFVLAAVKGNYGETITSLYTCAIWLRADQKTRAQRVFQRSWQKFGARMLPGGDLYERESRFLSFAAQRDDREVEEWLSTLTCPVISLDSTRPVEENLTRLMDLLQTTQQI